MGSMEHICMLPQEPKCSNMHPVAGMCTRLVCHLREMTLACEWHHMTAIFLRSRKSLRIERQKQLATSNIFIWHPFSCIKFYWETTVMFITFFALFYLPVQIFINCPNRMDPIIIFFDTIAFLDVCTKFNTGYIDPSIKNAILERKKIACNYIQSNFLLDVVGALPLQVIELYPSCHYPSHTVMFLFKLTRILSLRRNWRHFERQIQLPYIFSIIITIVVNIILFFHWASYIHFQVPNLYANMVDGGVNVFDKWMSRIAISPRTHVLIRYVRNLYYVAGLCVGAGHYGSLVEHNVPELLFTSSVALAAMVFLTYTFITLLRLAICSQHESFLFNGRLKELEEYMNLKRLPKTLQDKIEMFLIYKYKNKFFNEPMILNTINEHIKQDINIHCCKELVANVPLFENLPVALLNTFIFNMSRHLVMPGNIVVKCGQPGESLYLIASGTLAVIDKKGREIAHMRDGGYFGEMTVLFPGTLRSVTVYSLEITEIYKLNSKDFHACLQTYPHVKRKMEHMATTWTQGLYQ